VVKLLISRGADLNARDADDMTALHLACDRVDLAMARLLVEAGADVNARAFRGMTPLNTVCWTLVCTGGRGDRAVAEVVEMLLEHGADQEVADEDDFTPTRNAAVSGSAETLRLLRSHQLAKHK
jgi:ankyrin repeat protein